jgi:hypothetical protein
MLRVFGIDSWGHVDSDSEIMAGFNIRSINTLVTGVPGLYAHVEE